MISSDMRSSWRASRSAAHGWPREAKLEVVLQRRLRRHGLELLDVLARLSVKTPPVPRRNGRVSICASISATVGNFCGSWAHHLVQPVLHVVLERFGFRLMIHEVHAATPPRLAMKALRSTSMLDLLCGPLRPRATREADCPKGYAFAPRIQRKNAILSLHSPPDGRRLTLNTLTAAFLALEGRQQIQRAGYSSELSTGRRVHVAAADQEPGFAGGRRAELALGIGATTAIFSAVYAVVLQPLPLRDRRLMLVGEIYDGVPRVMSVGNWSTTP